MYNVDRQYREVRWNYPLSRSPKETENTVTVIFYMSWGGGENKKSIFSKLKLQNSTTLIPTHKGWSYYDFIVQEVIIRPLMW